MASTVHTDAIILDGMLGVDVTAQFAGTDDEPEAFWLYHAGTREEVSPEVYGQMDSEDWDIVSDAVWQQWH